VVVDEAVASTIQAVEGIVSSLNAPILSYTAHRKPAWARQADARETWSVALTPTMVLAVAAAALAWKSIALARLAMEKIQEGSGDTSDLVDACSPLFGLGGLVGAWVLRRSQ